MMNRLEEVKFAITDNGLRGVIEPFICKQCGNFNRYFQRGINEDFCGGYMDGYDPLYCLDSMIKAGDIRLEALEQWVEEEIQCGHQST